VSSSRIKLGNNSHKEILNDTAEFVSTCSRVNNAIGFLHGIDSFGESHFDKENNNFNKCIRDKNKIILNSVKLVN